MSKSDGSATYGLVVLGLLVMIPVSLAAWLTHIVVCIKSATWGLLIAGAIFFPIGIIHGIGVWFGAW